MTRNSIDPDRILFEDNHLIAYNKPAGWLVQADRTGDRPLSELMKSFIRERDNKPGNVFCGVIHRLDRPVSGVVLLAKTSKALERMNRQFAERKPIKGYVAIVENAPEQDSGTLRDELVRDQGKNKSFVSRKGGKDAKPAELSYSLVAASDRYFLLSVMPKTGRHHQIRVQLAHMGCVIKGDLKYGARRSNPDGSICLHARRLEFSHPVKKEPVVITAPLPQLQPWPSMEEQLLAFEGA